MDNKPKKEDEDEGKSETVVNPSDPEPEVSTRKAVRFNNMAEVIPKKSGVPELGELDRGGGDEEDSDNEAPFLMDEEVIFIKINIFHNIIFIL